VSEDLRAAEILDVEGCLSRFGGDKQLFLEMTTMLLEDAPGLCAQLHDAAAQRDAANVEARAHALKGLLRNCGGIRAARVAQALEDAGRQISLDATPQLLQSLAAELDSLSSAIRAYRG
jgi:HPt (histidine-containing phosphotransfer) domain-containing protein